jgi:hypothetical protein
MVEALLQSFSGASRQFIHGTMGDTVFLPLYLCDVKESVVRKSLRGYLIEGLSHCRPLYLKIITFYDFFHLTVTQPEMSPMIIYPNVAIVTMLV